MLIGKLRKYGIRDIAWDWIQETVPCRKWYGTKTETCDFPQGLCLGPLLFIIHLNDREKCLIDSKACLRADDTQITIASTNVENLNQIAMLKIIMMYRLVFLKM